MSYPKLQFECFSMGDRSEPAPKILAQIGQFRTKIWHQEPDVNHAALSADAWIDPLDTEAIHWIVRNPAAPEHLIAAARMTLHTTPEAVPYYWALHDLKIEAPLPWASFNRLVVHPDFRGQGIARHLDILRVQKAAEMLAGCAIVVAIAPRISGLTKIGFERLGATSHNKELLRTASNYEVAVHPLLGDLPQLSDNKKQTPP